MRKISALTLVIIFSLLVFLLLKKDKTNTKELANSDPARATTEPEQASSPILPKTVNPSGDSRKAWSDLTEEQVNTARYNASQSILASMADIRRIESEGSAVIDQTDDGGTVIIKVPPVPDSTIVTITKSDHTEDFSASTEDSLMRNRYTHLFQ